MKSPKIAKAGKLLCVDQGSYSDYNVIGFFVVLADFDPMVELESFLSDAPDQRDIFKSDAFLARLISKGFLLEVEHGSLYLGDYSSHDVSFTPANDAP